jgi:ribosomal protein S18 acetylase RimI-like enzyme
MKLDNPTFLISTRADTLTKALKESPQTITVWIRSGKYKDKMPLIRSDIIYEAKSKVDAKDYIKRFISIMTIPKTHTKLSILKGISGSQIFQLLSYTKKDQVIRKQTHDFDRFKSKKTFSAWEKRGKTIYTLINRNNKLLGIIWFSKKLFKNHRFTLAIRTYPPIRGRGVAKRFLDTAYQNFKTTHKKPNFWLKTEGNNSRALKLYRH